MRYTITIPGRLTLDVADIPAASLAYREAQDLSGEGASTFPEGTIELDGQTIARVSYNARIWALSSDKPLGGGKLIYCPGSAHEDEGRPDIYNEGREACWGRRKENPYNADSLEFRIFDRGFAFAKSCYA